jgi:hypothetical protein
MTRISTLIASLFLTNLAFAADANNTALVAYDGPLLTNDVHEL